jgi:hypothetical protein
MIGTFAPLIIEKKITMRQINDFRCTLSKFQEEVETNTNMISKRMRFDSCFDDVPSRLWIYPRNISFRRIH